MLMQTRASTAKVADSMQYQNHFEQNTCNTVPINEPNNIGKIYWKPSRQQYSFSFFAIELIDTS